MAGPYTRSSAELGAGAGKGSGKVGKKSNTVSKVRSGGGNDAAYLSALQELLYGGMDSGGGGTIRGGGGGGGGGGGFSSGPSAYDQWQIEQEKRRQAELDRRKMELTAGLQGARKQALPLLNQYSQQYGKDINNVFAQNRQLNAGYGQQLAQLSTQMNNQTNQQQQSLRRDLQAQGGGGSDLRAMQAAAGQNVAGSNMMNLLGQQYNQRLAQMMAMAQADAGSMGSAIKASSLGNLENSYAQLLAQIGMIGLQ